jgi:predicted transcriptional regulator of viral defense system
MSQTMKAVGTQGKRAIELLKQRGMLRQKEFVAAGIAPQTLARLVEEGAIMRPARGLYQLADAALETSHMLAEAAKLVPKAVVCLTSALQFHGLTLQMPSAIWMGIDRAAWRPTFAYPPVRFVRLAEWARVEGVERHRIDSVDVAITNPARTIVDCFRYRAKVGVDVAMEGLRAGLRERKCTVDDLWRYARKARVWSVMRPYLEAMKANA